jgi:hypothetical protein
MPTDGVFYAASLLCLKEVVDDEQTSGFLNSPQTASRFRKSIAFTLWVPLSTPLGYPQFEI